VAHLLTKCGEMDDGALGILIPTLQRELKQKTPDDVIYEAALDALGKLHSENKAATKTLTDLLKNKENSIVGRAAHAIAGYEGASGAVRKDLFEEVLKSSEGVFSGAQNPSNTTMVSKWNVIEQDVMEALNKLSRVKHKDPAAARQWFNDNKKRSWDEEK
jgi:hypothetical protein